jgi:hypothetical protein
MELSPFWEATSLSYSRISQHFMEPEGSLPCSEEPSTGPYHEPDDPWHCKFSRQWLWRLLSSEVWRSVCASGYPEDGGSRFPRNYLLDSTAAYSRKRQSSYGILFSTYFRRSYTVAYLSYHIRSWKKSCNTAGSISFVLAVNCFGFIVINLCSL